MRSFFHIALAGFMLGTPAVAQQEAENEVDQAHEESKEMIDELVRKFPNVFSSGNIVIMRSESACGGSASDTCNCNQRYVYSNGRGQCVYDSYCAKTNC